MDDFQCLGHPRGDFCFLVPPAFAEREGHISRDCERIEKCAALEQDSHLSADRAEFPLAQAGDFHPIHRDRAASGLKQTGQVLDQHGLAAARTAENHQRFPVKNIQIHTSQDLVVAELLRQAADTDEGFCGIRHGGIKRTGCAWNQGAWLGILNPDSPEFSPPTTLTAMSFTSLGLAPSLLKALQAAGLTEPTPIQSETIPAVIGKRDVLGIAKTGSGKTVSYVLPILHNLHTTAASRYREPSVLVLVPTRELADQVHRVFLTFLPALMDRFTCLAVSGGVSINPQMQAIGKADIVVATPGRLLELIEKNALRLSSIATLVLDEADKMLNLGFKEEVDRILALLPPVRQNLLFSATLSHDLTLSQQVWLNDPQVIKLATETDASELIHQLAYLVSEEKKGPLLRYLIKHGELQQVLVFASSTIKADGIVNKLLKNRIHAAAVHSKLSQQTRRDTLHQFKAGGLRVLVATDLLARGIDVEFLPCVINYELPRSPKDYIHRIGRTGRAENPGEAISLVSPAEMTHFELIQKKMGKHIKILSGDQIDLQGY